MTKVLAFDIAGNTGCAVGDAGGVPLCWSVDTGLQFDEHVRWANVQRFTEDCISKFKPDLVAVECPIGPNSSLFLNGAYACVVGRAHLHKVPHVKYQVQSIRKHFLGRALTKNDFPHLKPKEATAAIKKVVVQRCKALGWTVPDHDAADAAAVWDLACAKLKEKHQSIGALFDGKQ